MKEKPITAKDINVGDKIEVHFKIKDKDKGRIQIFKGLVVSKKGTNDSKMITVRKISYGIGVERIFTPQCPSVDKIIISSKGTVRRSKLYYMRDRVGKKAMKINKEQIL